MNKFFSAIGHGILSMLIVLHIVSAPVVPINADLTAKIKEEIKVKQNNVQPTTIKHGIITKTVIEKSNSTVNSQILSNSVDMRARILSLYQASVQKLLEYRNSTYPQLDSLKAQYDSLNSQINELQNKIQQEKENGYNAPGLVGQGIYGGETIFINDNLMKLQDLENQINQIINQYNQINREANLDSSIRLKQAETSICDLDPIMTSEVDRSYCHSVFSGK